MEEDNLDTDQTAQDEVADEQEEELPQEAEEQEDGEKGPEGFNDKQLQQIGSWLGRMVKKQIQTDVVPLVRREPGVPAPTLEKFNEELLNQILGGDVIGALDKVSTLRERAQKNLSEQKKAKLVNALTQYSDDPDYKAIYRDAEKIAEEAVSRNMQPEAAAELAIAKARLMKLEKKFEPAGNLGVTGNGKRVVRPKAKPLPKAFADRCKRDIADGIFKDEAEYRANLSPVVRRQYGI